MIRLHSLTGKCCLLVVAAAFSIALSGCGKKPEDPNRKPKYHIEWRTPRGEVDQVDVDDYFHRSDYITFIRPETKKQETVIFSGTTIITIKEN